SKREVGDAALLVDRDLTPRVDAAGPLPGALRPGVVAELSWIGNRVKRPRELAGHDVVGAKIARRRAVAFAGLGSRDEQVLEDASGCRARSAERPDGPSTHV